MKKMTNIDIILDRATEILGTPERAADWIEKVSATLGGSPRELAETNEGTDQVLLHLAGISRHESKS